MLRGCSLIDVIFRGLRVRCEMLELPVGFLIGPTDFDDGEGEGEKVHESGK